MHFLPENYSFNKFQKDGIAALTVTVLGLPQAMAYAIMAGVEPAYGLYASMLPVFICAFLGSSRFLVGGATNTVSILLYAAILQIQVGGVAVLFLPSEDRIQFIFALALLAGMIQLLIGITKLGRLATFLSYPVILGYTIGCSLLIAIGQIENFLGLSLKPTSSTFFLIRELTLNWSSIHILSAGIGIMSIIISVALKKLHKNFPAYFVVALLMTLFSYFFDFAGNGVHTASAVPSFLPPLSNPIPTMLSHLSDLFIPAFAIALISSVDTIANGSLFANKKNDPFDINQELMAQGTAKIVSAFTSAIPGSASFGRSAVNYSAGAESKLAAILSAFCMFIALMLCGKYIQYIPIPALAAMLIVTSIGMIKKKDISFLWRTNKQDRLVFLVTLASVVALGLDLALVIGFVLSLSIFLNNESHLKIEKIGLNLIHSHSSEWILQSKEAVVYNLEGALFFGATTSFENTFLKNMPKDPKVFILHLSRVHLIDSSGIHSIELFMHILKRKKAKLILSGANHEALETIHNSGICTGLDGCYIAGNLVGAIELAEYLLTCVRNHEDPDNIPDEELNYCLLDPSENEVKKQDREISLLEGRLRH